MNKYELALVVSAKVEDEVRNATVEKAKEYVTKFGGNITNVEEWGKLILSVDGVHIVIDSDIADAFAGKVDFRVLAGQNVVSA